LEILTRKKAGGVTLVVRGEVDFGNAASLRRHLEGQSAPEVEVDLGELAFLDSSGAGAMLEAAARLFRRGQVMRVVNVPGEIKESLDLIGFFVALAALECGAGEPKGGAGGGR
jgi:anti-anti-sigma factor